ncbi:MAG TPA: IS1595 family transposase [Candidatus Saccharimonadales bacterium]|jgi:transposase-like protein|nr:IS1595 family transposase [Candidatus Saccharimonadales bacterium]
MNRALKTLQQAIQYFSDEQTCIDAVANLRWPDGKPVCPKCGGTEHYYLATQKRWKCKNGKCAKQFSVKAGTIFEDSPLSLSKWLMAMWMISNCKNGVSSWEIHRAIGVTQKSAWFMMHRIRRVMQDGSLVKLGGSGKEVEVDETFIGGKARNMHKGVKARRITGQGNTTYDKVIVMGILERGKEVRTQVVPDRVKKTVQPIIREHVSAGTALFTDEMGGYRGMPEFTHQIIDHAVRYVDGKIHTNGMENFWSLLKRGLNGTYISVEPFHLFRYLDEQEFRYNNRGTRKAPIHDGQRFDRVLSKVAGQRLTYKELTGKVGVSETF